MEVDIEEQQCLIHSDVFQTCQSDVVSTALDYYSQSKSSRWIGLCCTMSTQVVDTYNVCHSPPIQLPNVTMNSDGSTLFTSH